MSIKETILKELLDHISEPTGLEEVYKRHSRSKGPLYSALAEATNELRLEYEDLLQKIRQMSAQRDQAESEMQTLEERRRSLELKAQGLEGERGPKEERLSNVQGLLNAADRLEGQGFTAENLDMLYEFLAGISASEGASPGEGVAKFFEVLEGWGGVVSMELEAQRAQRKTDTAKAEAGRWDATAKEKEARTKARIATIDAIENLLEKGVKEQDILEWNRLCTKADLSPRSLTANLTKLGSLEPLIKGKRRRCNFLTKEIGVLEAQTQVLKVNKNAVNLSIENFKIRALQNIQSAGDQARGYIDKLGEAAVAFGTISAEAAALGRHVALARVLRSQDPDAWGALLPSDLKQLLLGFLFWIKKHEFDPQVLPPEGFQRRLLISKYNAPTLSELILWTVSPLFTRDERAALTGKR